MDTILAKGWTRLNDQCVARGTAPIGRCLSWRHIRAISDAQVSYDALRGAVRAAQSATASGVRHGVWSDRRGKARRVAKARAPRTPVTTRDVRREVAGGASAAQERGGRRRSQPADPVRASAYDLPATAASAVLAHRLAAYERAKRARTTGADSGERSVARALFTGDGAGASHTASTL